MDTRSTAHDSKIASSRLTSSIATLILSLVVGVSMRSAAHLVPHADEQDTPYLGV